MSQYSILSHYGDIEMSTTFPPPPPPPPLDTVPPITTSKDPRVWGPPLWRYLHLSAANYPKNPTVREARAMMDWLIHLPVTIPCESCGVHYRQYITRNYNRLPVICSSRDNLFKFLVDIHNKVNERNGKRCLTYDEAWKLYDSVE